MKEIPQISAPFLSVVAGVLMLLSCSEEAKHGSETKRTGSAWSATDQRSLKEVGILVFEAVRSNDSSSVEDILPTKPDVEEIVMKFNGPEREKKAILAGAENNTAKIRRNTRRAVSEINQRGKRAGINWDEVEKVRIDSVLTTKNGLSMAELKIYIEYKTVSYSIKITECIQTQDGWMIFDKPKWEG